MKEQASSCSLPGSFPESAPAQLEWVISAQAPYCQLQDVQLSADKSCVSCIAARESLLHGEAHTPMAQWELLRHAANAGEFACAAVNPVKKRHYYLSISSGYELNAYAGTAPEWFAIGCCAALSQVRLCCQCVRTVTGAAARCHTVLALALDLRLPECV